MVRLTKMRDNLGQQRRGRTDGAIRSTADRRPMGENPSLASEAAAPPAGRQTTGRRPQSARRNSVDFAQWRDQVPENHLLHLLDRHISFDFVREKLKDS